MARASQPFPRAAKQARESATPRSWELYFSGRHQHHTRRLVGPVLQASDAAAADGRCSNAAGDPAEACTEPAQSEGKTEWTTGEHAARCSNAGDDATEAEADVGLGGGTEEGMICFD